MLYVTLDIQALKDLAEGLMPAAQKALQEATEILASSVHGKIVELAQSTLHSRRQMYLDALHFEKVQDDLYLITLDAKATWIEDGYGAGSMLDFLLKSPKAKTNKLGQKYLVVPFSHNTKPSERSPAQNDLIESIQSELKRRNLPKMNAIERDSLGRPKIGKIRSFNVPTPLKTGEGPGQGRGEVGQPRQGVTGIPHGNGVTFYQHKNPQGKMVKSAMTFRIASESQRGTGAWDRQAKEGTNFFQAATDWAYEELESHIYPGIMASLRSNT